MTLLNNNHYIIGERQARHAQHEGEKQEQAPPPTPTDWTRTAPSEKDSDQEAAPTCCF